MHGGEGLGSVRTFGGKFLILGAVVVAGLSACGGSGGGSGDAASVDSAKAVGSTKTSDNSAGDSGASLETFCKAALDNQGGAEIAPDDDPAAIADKLSANATSLEEMAKVAPADVKADATAVAVAARGMADAIAGDATLEKFNSLIADFATSDANTASGKVQTWVQDNCEAGQQ